MTNKLILITGDTGGLGFVISRKLITKGYSVIGLSSGKKKDQIEELSKLAQKYSVSYQNIPTDLSKPEYIHEHLQKSLTIKPQDISHIVLTHAVNFNEEIQSLRWDTVQKSLNINFGSSLMIAQYLYAFWIQMKEKTDRSLLFVSSVATKGGAPQEIAYHSAKRAMESAMLSFYRDGAQYGIRSNIVSPGLMDTAMGKKTLMDRPDVVKRVPLGKLTKVDDVTALVKVILESETITGQNFHVNAGRYATI